MKYMLVADQDGHRYVIPAAEVGNWLAWCDSDDYAYTDPPVSEVHEVDGQITFDAWEVM